METKEGFAYTIKGTKVTFPCKAYPTQLSMMDKIIRGLSRQENSLLESPTGSGKSLALLCSCLAWQRAEYEKQAKEQAEKEKAEYDDSCCCKPGAIGAFSHSSPDLMLIKPQQHNDMPDQVQRGIGASCGAVGVTCKQESDCAEKNEVLRDHTYTGNPPENDLEDGDFQAPKKRFRTPGFPQPSSRAKKQRLDGEDEVESEGPPEWTMELNMPPPPEGSGSTGEYSPEFKKFTDCKSENLEDIRVPKIYFGTRTHKQIAQITRELGKTAYKHARMCILSSREHSCIHPRVSKGKNKNEECKKLLDGSTGESCRYNQKAFAMSSQSGIRSQGLHSAWDIEDLVALGKKLKACPYYASRDLMKEADIVFCPYNYLIDPKIRHQMEIDLTDQVVVLDEGHNVEDSARDAASYSITAIQLQDAMSDLDKMGW